MGCLGISDLRNPGQWYCSEGDKDRKRFFLIEFFLFEEKILFRKSLCIVCTLCPARYCGIFANLRHCDINFCVMLHCILCNKILCWKHCIQQCIIKQWNLENRGHHGNRISYFPNSQTTRYVPSY